MAKKKKKAKKTGDKDGDNTGRNANGTFNDSHPNCWLPGKSANPAGRPPGRDIRKVFEELLSKEAKGGKAGTLLDLLTEAILEHAMGGNAPYMRELLDRTYGKVVQQVEVAESHTFVRQTDPERKNNDNDSESGE